MTGLGIDRRMVNWTQHIKASRPPDDGYPQPLLDLRGNGYFQRRVVGCCSRLYQVVPVTAP